MTAIHSAQNRVYLVGAGPGDPDLLTLKALRLIQQADVVVYDRLVSPEIMALLPSGVARIAVGKLPGHHCMAQEEINQLLVRLARHQRKVVRLKGGDPFIFGRGSEEALYLRQQGIDFEVVPGITSASAASAYAGIPLTHRSSSRGVRMLTGHFKEGEELHFDWAKLADPEVTLVIYMGLSNLEVICRQLILAGLAATTPSAAIQEGSTPRQRRVLADLGDLAQEVKRQRMTSPVMIIIGQVVELAHQLSWREEPAVTARLQAGA